MGRKHSFFLSALLLLGMAVSLSCGEDIRLSYEFAVRTQQFMEALVRGDSRSIYWMFAPAFRGEHSFARFDSAFQAWRSGRRVVRASRRLAEIRGPSGSASTAVWFEGDYDYTYTFQSWLNNGRAWELAWVTKILDQSFQYGRSDTAELRRVAQAGIRYVFSRAGLRQFNSMLEPPDTVVFMCKHRAEEAGLCLDSGVVVWLDSSDIVGQRMPRVPFYAEFGLVRITGELAHMTLDLMPTYPAGPLGPLRRGIEIFLKRHDGDWRFYEVGKVW